MKVVDFDGTVLDATFSVQPPEGGVVSVVFESSGGQEGGPNPRNIQYRPGLIVLLRRPSGDVGAGGAAMRHRGDVDDFRLLQCGMCSSEQDIVTAGSARGLWRSKGCDVTYKDLSKRCNQGSQIEGTLFRFCI